jgi:hypothetical protein
MANILPKSIDGVNYEIVEMPATQRSIIALQLKHIATGVGEGIKDIDSEMNYGKMVTGLLDRLEPEKGAHLLRDIIMSGIRFPVMEKYDDYDTAFTENYHHQVSLVAWIMEHNFGKVINDIKKKLVSTGIITRISLIVEKLENQAS